MSQAKAQIDYVTQLLREEGPRALPYSEDVKGGVIDHICDLLKEFPNLAIKAEEYTYNDGRSMRLLKINGTVPMYYQKVKYNIPVAIWLPETYPREAPIVYVAPTPDMIIKPNHRHVDPSGRVLTPYFEHWNFARSNLLDMCYDMSIHFGQEPPLFSKPPGWVPTQAHAPPPRPPPQQPHPNHNMFQASNPMVAPQPTPYPIPTPGGPSGYPPYGSQTGPASGPYPAAGSTGGHSGWPGQYGVGGGTGHAGGAGEVKTGSGEVMGTFREAARKVLADRLRVSVEAYGSQAAQEIDELLEVQNKLSARAGELQRGIAALQEERTTYEEQVKVMALKTEELTKWLNDAGEKVKESTEELDPSTVIVPADSLCEQALASQAEDMAIEDTLYALDKALQKGVIELDAYLKQVRQLCKQQFYARAIGMKVSEAQQHRQIPTSSNHHNYPSNAGVAMPQGDSWSQMGTLMNPLAGHNRH